MEARIAKPGKTLTISNYWVANFKLDEINTEFKLKIEKKNFNHCNIDNKRELRGSEDVQNKGTR